MRVCKDCNRDLPETAFYYSKADHRYLSRCKGCQSTFNKKSRSNPDAQEKIYQRSLTLKGAFPGPSGGRAHEVAGRWRMSWSVTFPLSFQTIAEVLSQLCLLGNPDFRESGSPPFRPANPLVGKAFPLAGAMVAGAPPSAGGDPATPP